MNIAFSLFWNSISRGLKFSNVQFEFKCSEKEIRFLIGKLSQLCVVFMEIAVVVADDAVVVNTRQKLSDNL